MVTASRKKKRTGAKKQKAKRRPRRNPADSFIAVARRIGADEDKATFEAKLGKIAKAVPADRQ